MLKANPNVSKDSVLRAIVVAGMHRSGTSAMTRVLSLLGGNLPKHLMKAHPDNPAGFWESQSVTDLNDEVLHALDSQWDDIFSFRRRPYLSNFDQYFLGRAEELLNQEFEQRDPIILKDPRLSVLATFWNRALHNAGYEPHYIVMVRNPLEVADSLRVRDSFPREKSFLLWSSYLIAVERDTRELRRTFVSYDQLMTNWRAVRRRLEAEMRMPFPRDTPAAALEIDAFLDGSLRHHRADDDLVSREEVPEEVKRLYRVFSAACEGAEVDYAAIDAIEDKLTEADALVGSLLADLRSRTRKLEQDVIELNDAHAGARAQADTLAEQLATERAAHQSQTEAAAQIAQKLEQALQEVRAQLAATEAARDEALKNNEMHLQHVGSLQDAQLALSTKQARLSEELQAAARTADELRHDLDQAQSKVGSADRARKAAEAALKDQQHAHAVERQRLSEELQAATLTADALRRDLQHAEAKATAAEAQWSDLKQELGSFEAEMETTIRGLEERVQRKAELMQREKTSLEAQLADQRGRADSQEAELADARKEAAHFRAVSASAESRLVKFEHRLEEVEQEFGATIVAVQHGAEERAQRLTGEIAHLQASLDALRSSLSWRATKPFRRTVGWVRKRFK